jgi:PPK2 family polyphosphate:nucleotide phosphotransferase
MLDKSVLDELRVKPGKKPRLAERSTTASEDAFGKELDKKERKARAEVVLEVSRNELYAAQELLYADDQYSVLVILQAMDAAGKDGTIKHVMSGLNPQGCQVYSFKKPSVEELDHTFLWRCMKALPERGRIGIFNRSYYEDVLVVKVHPEILDASPWPPGKPGKTFWEERYEDINAFEQHLVRNGTVVVKYFLHVSKEEQKKRLLERLADPAKHWKFSLADLDERARWKEYMNAYDDCLEATSTEWAPWYVIPADQKWAARALVATILADTIRSMDLKYPAVSPEQEAKLAEAARRLQAE